MVDISRIGEWVHEEVDRRLMYLVPSDPGGMSNERLYVCTDRSPDLCKLTRIGYVTGTRTPEAVYAMDGGYSDGCVSVSLSDGMPLSWEQAIMSVLHAYEQHRHKFFVRMTVDYCYLAPRP
ncbi:hypothetical protein ABZ858_26860 [Streptomyces sp. NPDC047017]|uniref:hypothetical protein n=1 Tax=Streptomyces sp. NPDC047017 TaxID=3155024 RepID=UPI0034110D27